VAIDRVGVMRTGTAIGVIVLVLLTTACTGTTSATSSQSVSTVTPGPSPGAKGSAAPTEAQAVGAIPRCQTAKGTPLFKAPLATGVPETYVSYGASESPTVPRLCFSLSVSNPSSFPDLQPCVGMTGRALEGPLRLTSGQKIWMTEPSGLTNSGPSPCFIPYG
jgi:hypothetical protein